MLGVATLTLGSSVIQSQAQHATLGATNGKVLAVPGSRRHNLSNRREPLPMGFVSSIDNSCSLFSSPCKDLRPAGQFATAVAAVDSDHLNSSDPAKKDGANKYYFVVANAKFMLDEEEHFKELLFERLRLYEERDKEQDFWLVIEPNFLDRFPDITKRLRRPAVALVSTNGPWITFMKLRLDRVLQESFKAESLEEALASNPTNLEFEKPEKWVAPYPKYEYGWWGPFLPSGQKEIPKDVGPALEACLCTFGNFVPCTMTVKLSGEPDFHSRFNLGFERDLLTSSGYGEMWGSCVLAGLD